MEQSAICYRDGGRKLCWSRDSLLAPSRNGRSYLLKPGPVSVHYVRTEPVVTSLQLVIQRFGSAVPEYYCYNNPNPILILTLPKP